MIYLATGKLLQKGLILLHALMLTASIATGQDCADGVCKLSPGKMASAAFDAMPSINVPLIVQGKRLSSLNGKTFALVEGNRLLHRC